MHKFYWNNARGGGGPPDGYQGEGRPYPDRYQGLPSTQSDYSVCGSATPTYSDYRNVHPVYNDGTVRVSVTGDQKTEMRPSTDKQCVGGSHRVLLKLRRLSGPNTSRPKSVPDLADLLPTQNQQARENLANDIKRLNRSVDEYDSLEALQSAKYGEALQRPGQPPARVRQSKSMHFVENKNKTWNLNTLRHYEDVPRVPSHSRPSVLTAGYLKHNYENVYGDTDTTAGDGGYYPTSSTPQPVRMSQLSTASPRSLRSRRKDFLSAMTESSGGGGKEEEEEGEEGETDEPQGSRRSRSRLSSKYQANKSFLYRSKSCDRPRVKETMRETFRISSDKLQSNLSRFSHNISDKLTSLQASSRMSTTSTGSTGRQSSSSDEGKPASPASWQINDPPTWPEQNASNSSRCNSSWEQQPPSHQQSILQSVAYKAIPCVELQTQCKGGRVSPTESIEYTASNEYKDVARPALSLAHRMRGKLHTVNKKISMIRSRSAERFHTRSPCLSTEQIPVRARTRTTSTEVEPLYEGPFIGHARAIVDYTPSPYDRDALRFKKDDIIDIISMNASGLWRGRCGNKVGNFKFINVEILPTREGRKSRSNSVCKDKKRTRQKPRTVHQLLRHLRMDEHIPVFVLNGYENMTLFQDLDDGELDYLGIQDPRQRADLLAAAEAMFDEAAEDAGEENETEKQANHFSRTYLRDSGCYEDGERTTGGQTDRSTRSSPVSLATVSAVSESSGVSDNNSETQVRGRPAQRNIRDRHVTSGSQAVMHDLSS